MGSDGEPRQHAVVAKVVIPPEQHEGPRHEFSIYEHLALSGVEGIPSVYGLFEDIETGVVMLVVEYGGLDLRQRNIAEGREESDVVSESERSVFLISRVWDASTDDRDSEGFLHVIAAIHKTGAWHGDLRQQISRLMCWAKQRSLISTVLGLARVGYSTRNHATKNPSKTWVCGPSVTQ